MDANTIRRYEFLSEELLRSYLRTKQVIDGQLLRARARRTTGGTFLFAATERAGPGVRFGGRRSRGTDAHLSWSMALGETPGERLHGEVAVVLQGGDPADPRTPTIALLEAYDTDLECPAVVHAWRLAFSNRPADGPLGFLALGRLARLCRGPVHERLLGKVRAVACRAATSADADTLLAEEEADAFLPLLVSLFLEAPRVSRPT